MKGQENLVPIATRTSEELRTMTKKGGIASGEARREKKSARLMAQAMADSIMKGKDGKELVNPLTGEPMTMLQGIIYKQYEKAYKNGDTAAFKALTDLLGETGSQAVNVNVAQVVQRTPQEILQILHDEIDEKI